MSQSVSPRRAPRWRDRGLFGHRDFMLLWAGQSVSDLGTAVTFLILPLIAVTTLHASAFEVGALAAAEWLPWLLIGLPAGAWVDRLRCRPLLIACDVARALLVGSVPLAAAFGVLTLAQLYIVALLAGVATVFFQVAYQAYLPALIPEEHLVEGNAKLQGSQSVAWVGGPSLGGLLAQIMRPAFALFTDAASYLVSAVTLLAIRSEEPVRQAEEQQPLRKEIADGTRYVLADPVLRVLTIAPALANLFYSGAEALFVLFLTRTVGVKPGLLGLLLAAASLGSVAGAVLARRLTRRLGTARAVWLITTLTTPFGLLVPLTGLGWRLTLFVAGLFVSTSGILVYNITVVAWRQTYCPPHILGRVVATMRFVLFGTIPLGALIAGALASVIGVRDALWVLFAANLSSPVVLAGSRLRGMRDLPGPTWPVEAGPPPDRAAPSPARLEGPS
jgi:MFS family permease